MQRATRAEARDAHRALGEAYLRRPDGLERAAWHLAEAATSADDEVADLLERAARTTLGRGDALTAVESLVRAASLSETNADRTRRIAQAAWLGSEVTGNLSAVAEMLAAARVADPDFRTGLAAAAAAASALLNSDGDVDTAHRLLVSAVENYAHRQAADDRVLIDALTTLNLICWYGGHEELWARTVQRSCAATSCSGTPTGWEQARRPPEPRSVQETDTRARSSNGGYPARGSGANPGHGLKRSKHKQRRRAARYHDCAPPARQPLPNPAKTPATTGLQPTQPREGTQFSCPTAAPHSGAVPF